MISTKRICNQNDATFWKLILTPPQQDVTMIVSMKGFCSAEVAAQPLLSLTGSQPAPTGLLNVAGRDSSGARGLQEEGLI